MKKTFKILIVIVIPLTILILLWGALNYFSYDRYHKTIYRTQTVDFNMLHHFAPAKISMALITNDLKSLDETLHSNFSLFDLLVTDCKTIQESCPEQKILYSNLIEPNPSFVLDGHSYDFLRSPVPMYAEKKFTDPHSTKAMPVDVVNTGEIIGRIYYARRAAPDFLDTLRFWVGNPKLHDRYTYTYNLIFSIVASLMVLAFLTLMYSRAEIARKKSEQIAQNEKLKSLQAELARQESEQIARDEKIKAVESENKYLKLVNFNNVIAHAIDEDFTSVVGNKVQRLDSVMQDIMLKMDVSVRDITHDMHKAPLLAKGSSAIDEINTAQSELAVGNQKGIGGLLTEVQQSIEAIKWVLDDINDIAKIDQQDVNIVKTIQRFESRLPPSVVTPTWLDIMFEYRAPEDTIIEANPHHVASIVKNALYNATAALSKKYRTLKRSKSPEAAGFRGLVTVVVDRTETEAIISIIDNGSGIPPEIIDKLYESSERISQASHATSGNGSIIVSAYLQLHDGKVRKINQESGATVIFSFPLKNKE